MSSRHRSRSEREQLELFRALPGDLAPRDAQDLMAYPFFSLSKSHRTAPIDFVAGDVSIRVEAVPDHGMATIWDADILIWAASQIVEARDKGLRTSRLMAATPYEILNFIGRGVSMRDYQRLKAALDRLQSTASLEYIARSLVVSINTVKTQTRSIYRKLGANSRDEAVRIAYDLGLLRPRLPLGRNRYEGDDRIA